ncbi:MAG: hypothetical protein HUU37_03465 [Bdellovibrionales bacterium]|nr:hypothetical protein [Bdellovibrionales bacterium]
MVPGVKEGLMVTLAVYGLLLSLSGCGNIQAGGDTGIDGVSKYDVTIANGQARLVVIFDNLNVDAGARIPLRRPAGAFIELGPDFQTGGTMLALSVPLANMFEGGGGLPTMGLPDGRPLPHVRAGSLAALATDLPVFGQCWLYLARDVFGIFIPVDLPNLPLTVTTRIRDGQGNVLGVVSGIPRGRTGSISGVLFLFPIDGGV